MSTPPLLRENRNPLTVPSPLHDIVEAVRTLDGVATLHEANECVFQPLQFLFSPFTCPQGVQEVAPLEIMANPGIDPQRRPPIYSDHSPMGRMTALTVWSIIGTIVAWWIPLPDGKAVVDWTDFLLAGTILTTGFFLLWWVIGLIATLMAGRFNLVPVMNNRTYGVWAVCLLLGGFIGGVYSRILPP